MSRTALLDSSPDSISQSSYSIQEASRITQVPGHVLRYWESKKLISPAYTTRGHRRYRPGDVERILKLKDWIYVKGMTVMGARKALIEESRRRKRAAELPLELATQSAASAVLSQARDVLKEVLQILR